MNKNEWIGSELLRQFEAEGTTAHRLCTIEGGWAERFGSDVLISFRTEPARDRLASDLGDSAKSLGLLIGRLFGRFLPKKNEERETPTLLSGKEGENLHIVATENHLRFGIDFGAGYSVGLFVDQRENRRFVRQAKPKRVLNFAAAKILSSMTCQSKDMVLSRTTCA
jgi:23S rRNA (cytosine1962-C5)-methyltransferase